MQTDSTEDQDTFLQRKKQLIYELYQNASNDSIT